MCVGISFQEDVLVVGARSGTLWFYDLKNTQLTATNHKIYDPLKRSNMVLHPQMVRYRAHHKEAITSISFTNLSQDQSRTFYTTGRDGVFSQFRLLPISDQVVKILNVSSLKISTDTVLKLGELKNSPFLANGDGMVSQNCEWMLEKSSSEKISEGWIEQVKNKKIN